VNPSNWQSPPAALQDDKTIKLESKPGFLLEAFQNTASQISRNYHHKRIRSNEKAHGELGWF
jgi:hypothetical protein